MRRGLERRVLPVRPVAARSVGRYRNPCGTARYQLAATACPVRYPTGSKAYEHVNIREAAAATENGPGSTRCSCRWR